MARQQLPKNDLPAPAGMLPPPATAEADAVSEADVAVAEPVEAAKPAKAEKAAAKSVKGKKTKLVEVEDDSEHIKVRATGVGFYGNQRLREGDLFEIKDMEAFSKKWMELV